MSKYKMFQIKLLSVTWNQEITRVQGDHIELFSLSKENDGMVLVCMCTLASLPPPQLGKPEAGVSSRLAAGAIRGWSHGTWPYVVNIFWSLYWQESCGGRQV